MKRAKTSGNGILASLIGLCLVATGAHAETPKIPDGAKPLVEAEIIRLLDGHQSKFTGYDEPITGTSNWNHADGTVSGTYSWEGAADAPFSAKWFLKDGKNCTQPDGHDAVCQTIYRTENGFIEVNKDGDVHAASTISK